MINFLFDLTLDVILDYYNDTNHWMYLLITPKGYNLF